MLDLFMKKPVVGKPKCNYFKIKIVFYSVVTCSLAEMETLSTAVTVRYSDYSPQFNAP